MRIRHYDSSLWRGGSSDMGTAQFPSLVIQPSHFTLVLKYRLHLVQEWSPLFSNIVKCLKCFSSTVWATCLDIKLTCFASNASRLFHLLSKQWRFRNKGLLAVQTCNINHQQLFVCYLSRIIPLKSTIKLCGNGSIYSCGVRHRVQILLRYLAKGM